MMTENPCVGGCQRVCHANMLLQSLFHKVPYILPITGVCCPTSPPHNKSLLSIIVADDPVTCAAYAKENDLLALEGWCRFRNLAKKDKVLARAIKQSKI